MFITIQTILLILQTGSEFNENGNVRNWWTNKSRENFVKRSTCLINQYNKVKIFGYKVRAVSSFSARWVPVSIGGARDLCSPIVRGGGGNFF